MPQSAEYADRTSPPNDPFSDEKVIRIILNAGLLSQNQINEVLKKKGGILNRLTAAHNKRHVNTAGLRITRHFTIIDVIVSLKLFRADKKHEKLDEELIFQALARDWGIPFKKIDPLKLDLNVVTTTIPRNFALKHQVLPIEIQDGCLTVATSDPFNTETLEDLSRASQMKLKVVVSPRTDIIKCIDEFFGFKRSIAKAEGLYDSTSIDLGNLEQYVRLKSADEVQLDDQHIVNAVNHLFVYAFDQRASDIHIEPKREITVVRMRIDGVLHTVYKIPKKVHVAIVSRIKTLSRLDIAEKRRPQDGRIKMDNEGTEVEIRVSTLPVAFGEKVVMRVMDPDILFQGLTELGFTESDLVHYNRFITRPHGIVMICGPTGSGKSTTLYSTLRQISTPEVNITTIEDPIEMIHEDFNQIAVQPAVGITFATILRTILRQDPDIIMIGEMRDLETATNAVQAAMTGHLVFSTIHTNDAPSTITRLLDLGVPSFLIQTTIIGILAQRLVRKICTSCKESFEIDSDELKRVMNIKIKQEGKITLFRGKGCTKCRGTGYRGRAAIFEALPYSDTLKKMTTPETDLTALSLQARKEGMVTLRENAVKKLISGITTYQEVVRVTMDHF
ncbi:MAG: GspE/PulE family protein [Pseudomonadota bacterium]